MGYYSESDVQRLSSFYAALIRDCEYRIEQNRTAFWLEIARIKSPDAKAKYQGNYTDENCWKAYASDDFIQVVRDLSDMCGTEIGALPLLLTDPLNGSSDEDV